VAKGYEGVEDDEWRTDGQRKGKIGRGIMINQKLVLEVVRQNRSWTICSLTMPSESFCGRGRGSPVTIEVRTGVPPTSDLDRHIGYAPLAGRGGDAGLEVFIVLS